MLSTAFLYVKHHNLDEKYHNLYEKYHNLYEKYHNLFRFPTAEDIVSTSRQLKNMFKMYYKSFLAVICMPLLIFVFSQQEDGFLQLLRLKCMFETEND